MPTTPWLPTVSIISNGADVSAEVVNPISAQHTQRSQHLYEKFQELTNKSVLIAFDQPILEAELANVRTNLVVFYDLDQSTNPDTEGLSPAKVQFTSGTDFSSSYTPANSSYAVGIVKSISNELADVYLYGLIDFDYDMDDPDDGIIQSDEIDQDAVFLPGPFYLSRSEAGKLTRNPGGVAIYVGYAFNRKKFLLAPNVSEFNQFFTTYKFNLLDRPAGRPELTDSTWDITGVAEVSGDGGINYVGWVPVSSLAGGPLEGLIPDNAKFYYNLPAESLITADTGIDSDSILRNEQVELSRTLPPNPTNVTLLTVNGVIQQSRDNVTDGVYIINSAGIWWFGDQDAEQPWGSDIIVETAVTFNSTTNEVTVPSGGFAVGDKLRFKTGGTLPSGILSTSTYYVKTVDISGDDQIITIAATVGGAEIDFTTNGAGPIYIPQIYTWKFTFGDTEYRPRLSLQFLKFNPALRESVVTSIKRYNPNSSALKFYRPDKGQEATSGDLLVRLNIPVTTSAVSGTGSTVTDISFNETTGELTKSISPVINDLVAGTGITISQRSANGVDVPGSYIVASSSANQLGRVSYLEPDGIELIYSGLHSYLSVPPLATLPSSLTGKIVLPTGVPDADMSFVLLMLGESNLSLANSARVVEFTFSYNVTKPGAVLNNTVTTKTISFNIPNSVEAYTAKTCFKVGNVVASTYSIPIANLTIPAIAFKGGDSIVNFKLERTTPSSAYTGSVGIADIYWRIG